jgi:predicted transcriptional regulator
MSLDPVMLRARTPTTGRRSKPLAMSVPSPDATALGRAVQAIRAERKISQVQLAANTGFRQSWISNVEHGRRNPSWSNVVRLATGLGVSTSTLVKRAEALTNDPK